MLPSALWDGLLDTVTLKGTSRVKAKATEVLNQLTEAVFQHCFQQWKSRMERCRDRQGESIEGENVAIILSSWICDHGCKEGGVKQEEIKKSMNKDNGPIPTSPLFAVINKDSYGSVNRDNKLSYKAETSYHLRNNTTAASGIKSASPRCCVLALLPIGVRSITANNKLELIKQAAFICKLTIALRDFGLGLKILEFQDYDFLKAYAYKICQCTEI
ncbi:hypothetical protein NQ318_006936 [Aromia moschata]|uniref:Uncharacterized protein n=1 Tax=Aromia moschata TaxID=1265417 RepID=A0AAV8YNR8_9CUCU|nr:hypothetical protein NQ318_006936 [Aromia moschata]